MTARTVALSCGHGLQLLTAQDPIPDDGPWCLYPLDDDNSVEPGDQMTCIACGTVQRVTGTSPELIPMDHTGRLTL